MIPYPEQIRLDQSQARFKVVPAGRRSGKTERAKRHLVRRALMASGTALAFFAAAPTRDQAKKIYWDDLKMLTKGFWRRPPSESLLILYLINGSEIHVLGMDRPERIEGSPWAGGILDEYANMKEETWPLHVQPALDDIRTPNSWCWFIGVPEGRNHYYDLYKRALGEWNVANGGQWDGFHWKSSAILPPEKIAAARATMDELSFQQEYEASFVNFSGMAYYPWDEAFHTAHGLADLYNPRADLVITMDFNVEPGTAAIIQEVELPRKVIPVPGVVVDGRRLLKDTIMEDATYGTAVIGEVHIPTNSNTPAVCKKIIQDWGDHQGRVKIYGDATGGSRGTSQTEGSDWDLIKNAFYAHYGSERVHIKLPTTESGKHQNPTERSRVNAVNSRLLTGDGSIRLMVDAAKAPRTVEDFEGVRLLEGGSGEIDKKATPKLTHLTDGIGYYVNYEFPLRKEQTLFTELRA